jgi:polyphosphate kinase 2 (PPK2 family)
VRKRRRFFLRRRYCLLAHCPLPTLQMTHDWKAIDAAVRVEPGEKSKLKARNCVGADLFPEREAAEEALKECAKAIDDLQDRLWAERSRALLVILQGIDTSGKDGTVRGVFNKCGPLGVNVTAVRQTDRKKNSRTIIFGACIWRRRRRA